VASLPPISSEVFNEKVLTAQASTSAAADKASFQKNCTVCQRTYFSENAYQNHIGSQKHKLRLAASQKGSAAETTSMVSSTMSLGEPISGNYSLSQKGPDAEAQVEKVVDGLKDTSISDKGDGLSRGPLGLHHSPAEQRQEHPSSPSTVTNPPVPSEGNPSDIPICRCLFCNYDSPTCKLSVAHMTKIHGLFIPEQNYLVDLEGLLRYFQAKIHQNNECLYCHKLKNTASAVQTHMRDKGHCMIAFETEEEMIEVGQFYDFSSTYSDEDRDEMELSDAEIDELSRNANGGVELPKPSQSRDKHNGDEEGWETDSSFSSLDSAELTAVPIDDHSHQYERLPMHRHHSHTDARPHRSKDGFHSHAHHHGANAVFHDDYELHLPNGRTVGHRSLRKYYRQNLHSYPTAAERNERAQRLLEDGDDDDDSEMEDIPDSPQLRRTQIARRNEGGMLGATSAQKNFAMVAEKRDRRHGERAQNRYQAKLEKQNNFQKHFRVSQDLTNRLYICNSYADLYLGSSSSVVFHAAQRAQA
jgi:pre-60S factor REI1